MKLFEFSRNANMRYWNIVNQRSLTYVSEKIDDLMPLTPSIFLQHIRESGILAFEISDFLDIID